MRTILFTSYETAVDMNVKDVTVHRHFALGLQSFFLLDLETLGGILVCLSGFFR